MQNDKQQKIKTALAEGDMDTLFDMAIEEKAKELEITVDYYMSEFM